MVIIDTSAWIEYFKNGAAPVVAKVGRCLDQDLVGIGDLVYCEVMQGIRSPRQYSEISSLFHTLAHFEMAGFHIAEKSAANYRLLRSKGVTVRKTIDMFIGTFCVTNAFQLVHHDSDFDLMAPHIGLDII